MLQHVKEESPKTKGESIAPAENYDLVNKKVFDILGFFCEVTTREKIAKIVGKTVTEKSDQVSWRIHAHGIPRGTFRIEVPASQPHCYTISSLEHLIREGFPVISGTPSKGHWVLLTSSWQR